MGPRDPGCLAAARSGSSGPGTRAGCSSQTRHHQALIAHMPGEVPCLPPNPQPAGPAVPNPDAWLMDSHQASCGPSPCKHVKEPAHWLQWEQKFARRRGGGRRGSPPRPAARPFALVRPARSPTPTQPSGSRPPLLCPAPPHPAPSPLHITHALLTLYHPRRANTRSDAGPGALLLPPCPRHARLLAGTGTAHSWQGGLLTGSWQLPQSPRW